VAKKASIVRYTAEELAAMRARGESRTDWARAGSMSDAALAASIAADPDEAGMEIDWTTASIAMPERKAVLNMRVDHEVLAFFKQTGRGYQTRINAVLRAFVNAQQRRAG
jgi:uncharacterized protein (DUF4415 family)